MHSKRGREYERTREFSNWFGGNQRARVFVRSEENRRGRSCWNRIAFKVFVHLNPDLL